MLKTGCVNRNKTRLAEYYAALLIQRSPDSCDNKISVKATLMKSIIDLASWGVIEPIMIMTKDKAVNTVCAMHRQLK